jgi:hypothetical protein
MNKEIEHLLNSNLDLNLSVSKESDFYIARWGFKTRLKDAAIKNTPKMMIRTSIHDVEVKDFAEQVASTLMGSIENWAQHVEESFDEEKVWNTLKTKTEKATAEAKVISDKEALLKSKMDSAKNVIKGIIEGKPIDKDALRRNIDKLVKLDPQNKWAKEIINTHLATGSLFENV